MTVITQAEIDHRIADLTPRQAQMYNSIIAGLQIAFPTDEDCKNLVVIMKLFVDVMETVIAEDM